MKKIFVFILGLTIALSLAACGRRNNAEATKPTATTPTILPTTDDTMLPTIETNIPDPSVDTKMPAYTEDTNATTGTDNTADTNTGSNSK